VVDRYDYLMENKRYDDAHGIDVIANWKNYELMPSLAEIDDVILSDVNRSLVRENKGHYIVKMSRKVFKKKPVKKQKTVVMREPSYDPTLTQFPEFAETVSGNRYADLPLYAPNENGEGVAVPLSERKVGLGDAVYAAVTIQAFDASPNDTMGIRLEPVMLYKVRSSSRGARDKPGSEQQYVVTFKSNHS
jgi:hypothetical protein